MTDQTAATGIPFTATDRAALSASIKRRGVHLCVTNAYREDGWPEMAEVRIAEKATDSLESMERSAMLGGIKRLTGMNGRLIALIFRSATEGIVVAESDGSGRWVGNDMAEALGNGRASDRAS